VEGRGASRRAGRRLSGAAPTLALLALAAAAGPTAPAPGLAGAACVACRAAPEELRRGLSDPDWSSVLAGEIVAGEAPSASEGDGVGRSVSAAGLVGAAPAQVWSVLTDWPSYPSFMPNVADTRVRRLEARRAWLSQHLRVFWSDVRYGTVWELDPEGGRLRFALDPDVAHDIAAAEGAWRLAALPQDGRTLLRYEARIDTGLAVPAFVQAALTRRSLPGLVRAVRDEVARRSAASP
jgi:hypothetical protein